MYYRWLWLSQFFFCMIGCCFSLIEQDVSVLFCQAVSVVGRGCSPKPAVDVLSLFSHFLFWIRWNGRELHILPSCFPTAPLMSVSFALLFVLDIMWFCILFADVCVLQKGGLSQGLGILFSRSLLSCFFFLFVWKYFISAFLFSSCLSLFSFLFAVFLVLLFCQYARMIALFLSDFFSCLLYSIFVYSFFSLNSISLHKHWFLNFICFLTIVYKDIKKYLFLCV